MRAYKICFVLSVILLVSCGQQIGDEDPQPFRAQQNKTEEERLRHHAQPKLLLQANDESLGEIEAFYIDDVAYVPVVHTLELLDFQVEEKQGQIKAGFTDPYITLKRNSNQAMVEGKVDTLPMPLTKRDGHILIAVPSLKDILGVNTQVQTVNGTLLIVTEYDAQQYGFAYEESLEGLNATQGLNDENSNIEMSSKSANIIRDAQQYLGTAYEFGAKTNQTSTFDSSSFVQHVYQQNGIELPRMTRNIAKLGLPVAVQELQPGDLLFFYWPGRYESSRSVGHVGIYLGEGKMIHSSPLPNNGVQIENLLDTSSIFSDAFLGAKRFVE